VGGEGRLRAVDAVWLELERGGPPVTIGSVSLCDGPAPGIRELRSLVRERLALMPRLEQRADEGHRWVAAPVDLAHHVRRRTLPTGSRRALDAYVGHLMAEPLDPARPLWGLRLVQGLDADRWALVWRLHHSLADGLGALLLVGHVFDTAPSGGRTLPQAVVAGAREAPAAATGSPARRGSRLLRVGSATAAGTLHAAGAAVAALPHLAEAARSVVPSPPSSPLTGSLGPGRRWRSLELELADVKSVGRAEGGTVNDVVVALVAAGLRTWLLRAGVDLAADQSVRCMLPVSLRRPGDDASGNQVSAILAHLPVGIADPHERFRAIARHLDELKRSRGFLAVPVLLDLVDRTVPTSVQELAVGQVGDAMTPWLVEAVATNVPGPPFPLWVLGRPVRSIHPVIPLAAQVRTTIGVLSYDGTLDVGVTVASGVDGGPDADVIAEAMAAELERLRRTRA
jgi:WS/DGAT/MGAT family acyltransferase